MGITRRTADEAVLRDNTALHAYVHDHANLALNVGMEMQIIARASRRRLAHAPSRSSLMSASEKKQAANRVARDLRRAALLQSHVSKLLANADGILQNVFVPQRGGRRNNNGGNNSGGRRNNNARNQQNRNAA